MRSSACLDFFLNHWLYQISFYTTVFIYSGRFRVSNTLFETGFYDKISIVVLRFYRISNLSSIKLNTISFYYKTLLGIQNIGYFVYIVLNSISSFIFKIYFENIDGYEFPHSFLFFRDKTDFLQ
ncbi:hypothetical protein AYB34_00080 [Leptospira sp. ZV016]|nr:hypothetical protein LEP1GSC166_1547 [Leptospira kirschneri]KXZ24969.1 hypothetical protein AYB32_04660 [Leptospira kirschneri]KXZ33099.1 hypothetical protein AYB34_00080 [Leptospira sp. ZV016]